MRKAIIFLFLFLIIVLITVGCKKEETEWDKDFKEIENDLENLDKNLTEIETGSIENFNEIENLISQS